jgi:hypothetical protein
LKAKFGTLHLYEGGALRLVAAHNVPPAFAEARRRGTPNKKTALRDSALAAATANPEISPLEFLLGIMRDPNVSSDLRFKAAQTTLPFVHAKPGSARPGDPGGAAKLIDGSRW